MIMMEVDYPISIPALGCLGSFIWLVQAGRCGGEMAKVGVAHLVRLGSERWAELTHRFVLPPSDR